MENSLINNNFNPTKKITPFIWIDENNKLFALKKNIFSFKPKLIYRYEDILDFELLEDGNSITKGGLGSAVVGGAIFGVAGAVVGGVTGKRKTKSTCSKLQIKITLNNSTKPIHYLIFIASEVKKNSFTYKTNYDLAQNVLSMLQIICSNSSKKNEITNNSQINYTQQLEELAMLREKNIISNEEFNNKKQEILSKM